MKINIKLLIYKCFTLLSAVSWLFILPAALVGVGDKVIEVLIILGWTFAFLTMISPFIFFRKNKGKLDKLNSNRIIQTEFNSIDDIIFLLNEKQYTNTIITNTHIRVFSKKNNIIVMDYMDELTDQYIFEFLNCVNEYLKSKDYENIYVLISVDKINVSFRNFINSWYTK